MKIIGDILKNITGIFYKKTRNGEKEQEIEENKMLTFSKVLAIVFLGVFTMCVLSSLFPKLAITDWYFSIFERILNYIIEVGR